MISESKDNKIVIHLDSAFAHASKLFLVVMTPLWLVVMPFVAVYHTLYHAYSHAAGALMISLASFALLIFLSDDRIRLDATGIDLPRFIVPQLWRKRELAWSEIHGLALSGGKNKRRYLELLTASGKYKIELSLLGAEASRKLLVSLNLWLAPAVSREALDTLKAGEIKELPPELTFTSIWQSSFASSGFGNTAFVPLEPGERLKKSTLTVIKPLSYGGLAAVYLCRDNNGELRVLKESVVPFSARAELRAKAEELFKREAALLLKVDHPQLARVCDFFEEGERTYLLLSYEDGLSLRQKVKEQGALEAREVCKIALSLLEPVRYLHMSTPPLVHRDISPENIILRDDGTAVLIDFGAAAEFLGTATGTMVGKQCYMSPEQFKGKARAASDIYSLGATLYYLATASEPTPLSVLEASGVDERLAALIKRMTALEYNERLTIDTIEKELELCLV